jgi:hypothetical protein
MLRRPGPGHHLTRVMAKQLMVFHRLILAIHLHFERITPWYTGGDAVMELVSLCWS